MTHARSTRATGGHGSSRSRCRGRGRSYEQDRWLPEAGNWVAPIRRTGSRAVSRSRTCRPGTCAQGKYGNAGRSSRGCVCSRAPGYSAPSVALCHLLGPGTSTSGVRVKDGKVRHRSLQTPAAGETNSARLLRSRATTTPPLDQGRVLVRLRWPSARGQVGRLDKVRDHSSGIGPSSVWTTREPPVQHRGSRKFLSIRDPWPSRGHAR